MKYITKSFKYRIYPNKNQINKFEQDLMASRYVYNKSRQIYKKDKNKHKTKHYGKKYFYNILLKLLQENPELQKTDKSILINSYHNLIKSLLKYKDLSKYPKKKKRKSTESFRLRHKSGDKIKNNKIYIKEYGFLKLHNKIKVRGNISNYTIKKQNNQWYLIITCTRVSTKTYPKTGKKVGIRLGLTDLIILSNGQKIGKPDLSKIEEKINKLKRSLSRRKKNSKNYKKTKKELHKIYQHRSNIIEDYLHKISTKIVKEYDFIAIETPNTKRINKNQLDNIFYFNWHKLIQMIKYKAFMYKKIFIKIPRKYPSLKLCNNCNYLNKNIVINMKMWTCRKCGKHHDSDINTAINILNKGLKIKGYN